jgi:hypothetical protein
MKKILAIVIFCFSSAVFAQEEEEPDDLAFPYNGKTVEDFVIAGYKLITSAYGDLNKDGKEDAVLIVEQTNTGYIIANDGLGPKVLNTNPRVVIIVLKDKEGSGYTMADINGVFIPSPNSFESPCLEDPFLGYDGIAIKKGVLWVHFGLWSSCGGYGTTSQLFKIRLEGEKFKLIGYESSSFSRSMGGKSSVSINYLTKKACIVSGGNEFDETRNKPSTVWKDIKAGELKTFGELPSPIDFEYEL